MPHFILDCSENILELREPRKILEAVFETAFSTGLFDRDDIKVRLNPFKHSLVQSESADFIHVFGNIMEGRTGEQKSDLSYAIVATLTTLFPKVPVISMNIRDFEANTYCNKSMI
ncbi:5-carboxymethyl-2-hydroxymuconate Delta-isomerase [Polaribacter atrinae]|uniref:5-carboxymethyl-2-hydroxymuconate isomerase n=1 Tax=Polaribacter atrinae TaxID=1333662 RepID=A0A176TB50_9FLAO|nr:5-carboxymethyl-2-hydroxymuconate Delta-isomerase [Polaribacter atrinae]OAD44911.1 5-carboxymethyl-2-hydroxymuconate isomerase [Polaribacter atrinae]